MGDAAASQATASGFGPMLGVSMVGSMPGAVSGPVARGSAVPQLHSAIVERLRARIELCRKHHSTCESRYQRGQAENSDREHESTLHLLNIVQQGSGSRKIKGSRLAAQQSSEYNSRANGEQKSQNGADGEQKNTTRSALNGTLRRKIEGHPPEYNPKQNKLSSSVLNPLYKHVRMEGEPLVHGGCVFSNGQAPVGNNLMSHSTNRKDTVAPNIGSDLFGLTLKEMKKEPGEVHSCGKAFPGSCMAFGFKDEGGGQIDPDLQDLFDELTRSVPPMNDQDFEKMLKQDDTFGLDLGESGSMGEGELCSQLQKVIKTEYSPGFAQDPVGLAQLQPPSRGPNFSVACSSSTSSHPAPLPASSSQGSHSSRGPTSWLEVSHAEQLKQMAANQQSPVLLHQQQPGQPGAVTGWPSPIATHSTPGLLRLPKMLGSAAACQQGIGPRGLGLAPLNSSQSKGPNDCLVQPGRHSGPNFKDANRPLSMHLQHSVITGTQRKPMLPQQVQQLQHSAGAQNPHGPVHFRTPHLPIPASPCMQNKPLPQKRTIGQCGQGLHIKPAQQRQDKINTENQLSCHLTRPPPDYKQTRQSMAEVLQPALYAGGACSSGMSSSPTLLGTVSGQSGFYMDPSHLPTCQDVKVTVSSVGKRYTGRADDHTGIYSQADIRPLQLACEKNHTRVPSVHGQQLDGMMTNGSTPVPANWGQCPKQALLPSMLGTGKYPDASQVHQANFDFSTMPTNTSDQPDVKPLPLGEGFSRQSVGTARAPGARATQLSTSPVTSAVSEGPFAATAHNHSGSMTLDFLPEGDNVVPGINAESDFIDSLLKSGSGNDDWMKDINLDEILGGHT